MRKKQAFKNLVSSLLLQLVTIIAGFIVPKLIITNFGSDVNGLVVSITKFLAYITLLEAGIGPIVKATLYKPIADKDKSQIQSILKATQKFFRKIAYIFVGYLIILGIIYPLLVNIQFDFIFTLSLIIVISISTFFEYFFGITYKLYLHSNQKSYVISLVQVSTLVLNTVLIMILIKLDCSILIVKLVSSLAMVLRPMILNYYVKRKCNISLAKADNTYNLRQKWDGLVQHIASIIHNNTDIVILTIFTKLSEVSVYAIYAMIITALKNLLIAINDSVTAAFGDMIAKKEHENLNKKFGNYEFLYFSILSISFSCIFTLIVPFVKIYTFGINDANYIRPIFAFIIISAEYFCCIRLPYISLAYAAGKFKETRTGAILECVINIILSLILVRKYGMVGIAIGTLVAMLYRTIEFVIFTSKNILKRSILYCIKKVMFSTTIITLTIAIDKVFINIKVNSYYDWIIYAIIVGIVSSVIWVIISIIFDNNNLKLIFDKLFKRRKSEA